MKRDPLDSIATETVGRRLGRANVDRAVRQLGNRVSKTPVVRSDKLDSLAGARLWMKAENLQRGGSFKIRGALLAVDRLAALGSCGIVAQSTGNHAIAVALASFEHGLPTIVVLPCDAAPTKVGQIRRAGAEVVFAGTSLAERLAVVEELRQLHGYDVIDPYESTDVVVGQGTATAELISQVAAEGGRLNSVVVPVGGGSAIAGACLAASGLDLTVVGAEPEAVPAFSAALHAQGPVTVPARHTIADGLRPDRIGHLPFDLCHQVVAGVVKVQEAAIADALRAALLYSRLLIEPAAATALAAALQYSGATGTDVGVLLSGGNIEPSILTSLLTGEL
ncbi:MAG TPA: pyridoxal-phosphate dependent enzyme [Candidatus Limnocylindrales bacterium]|nr:pyridoxal-phosphate dependent enzyme [Candidatus Limnocylindrales bacterium]